MAEKLRQRPEVGRVLTLQSFVPEDQEAKLTLIEDAGFFLQNTLNLGEIDPEASPADTRSAMQSLMRDLSDAANRYNDAAGAKARRLATAFIHLASAPPTALEQARPVLIAPLLKTLHQARQLLALGAFNLLPLLRLRVLPREPPRQLLLAGGQRVDAEAALGADRGERAGAAVEAGEHHRRVQRQRGDRVRGGAGGAVLADRGDNGHAGRVGTQRGSKLLRGDGHG